MNPVTNHTWNWSCDEAPCTYEFIVDTSSDTTLQDYNFTTTQTSTINVGSPDAFYYLHIRARDSAGNISATSRYLAVVGNFPNTPNALTLNSPASAISPVTTPTIAVAGTTSGEVISLHTNADCSDAAIASNTATGITTLLTPSLSIDQVYTFYARAFNGSNYSSCSLASLNYTLDRVPPTTPTGLADGSFALLSYSPYLSWQPSTDSLSGLARYEIQLETLATSSVISPWTSIGLATNHTYSSLSLTAGSTYKVRVRAVDQAGNTSTNVASDGWTAKAEDTLVGPVCFTSNYLVPGEVKTAVVDGTTAYVGGSFIGVGRCHGGLILLDAAGSFVSTYSLAGNVAGTAEDASGGMIVYGSFSFKQGAYSAKNILRINPDTSVDTNFNVTFNGDITAATVVGNNLYVAGSFTTINGTARAGLGVLDLSSVSNPTLHTFTASITGSPVQGFHFDTNYSELYVYGSFTGFAGDTSRKYVARLQNPGSSTPTIDTGWLPTFDNAVKTVTSIGTTIFFGGSFFKVNTFDSRFITKMDRTDGTFTTVANAYSSSTNSNYAIRRLVVKNSELFAEGSSYLYRINQTTLGPQHSLNIGSWNFGIIGETDSGLLISSSSGIKEVTIPAGSSLGFSTYNLPTWGGMPFSVKKFGASNYLLGGAFTIVGSLIPRTNLAAIDVSTGNLKPWQPTTSSEINKIILNGSHLYAAGTFTTASGIASSRIAKIDKNSGNILPSEIQTDSTTHDLAIVGGNIIATGYFTGINSTSKTRLGGVNLSTGQVLSWDPFPSSTVHQLKAMGGQLILTGDFSSIASSNRSGLGIFDSALNLLPTTMNTPSLVRIDADNNNIVGAGFYEDSNYRCLSYYDSNLNLIWRTNNAGFYSNYIHLKMSPSNCLAFFFPEV